MGSSRKGIPGSLLTLSDSGQDFVVDHQAIAHKAIDYFKALWSDDSSMGSSVPIPKKKLSAAAKEWLDSLITDAEIKEVVFEVDSNKSPGPYGFTALYCKILPSILEHYQR